MSLAGTVVDVAWGLAGHDLVVDVGVPLRVTLPSGDQELMQLSPGHTVHLALVPGAAHLVPGSGNGRG